MEAGFAMAQGVFRSLYLESSWTSQGWLLITSLYRVCDFSSVACWLNSLNLFKLLGCDLSDGLCECLGCSSMTLKYVLLMVHGHLWKCFFIETSWNLFEKDFQIFLQTLHFPLGMEIWHNWLLFKHSLLLARGHDTPLQFFLVFFLAILSLSLMQASSTHSLNTADPQVSI